MIEKSIIRYGGFSMNIICSRHMYSYRLKVFNPGGHDTIFKVGSFFEKNEIVAIGKLYDIFNTNSKKYTPEKIKASIVR